MDQSKRKNGTFIHGIASSEHLDSSGERIKIEGVDITSLTTDGVLNLEHQSKEASSIVGKIWEAKKILKRSDCENDHQRYFWDKVKMPYIYIAGELFDGVGHKEASEIAAMVRFDSQEPLNKDAKRLINFSIEGSRVEKTGSVITKCIARKISLTLTPCNKVCEAEELKMAPDAKKESDSGEFSFIQDIMSKADEPSCQIMKGENPFLYKNEEIKIPAKEAVKEHKRLIAVLDSPSHKDDKEESKKQRKELKEYKEKLGKADKKISPKDPVLNPSKFPPKTPTEAKQKEYAAKVTAMQNKKVAKKEDKGVLSKPYASDAQRRWAHTPKGKEALGGAKEVAHWDKESKGKKMPEKKKKLDKYESNVRKALTASCGMGSPSTKVQGEAMGKSEFLYKNEQIPQNSNGKKIGTTQSGKSIFSHVRVANYKGFSPQDHAEAADFHRQMILKSPSFEDKEMHLNKMRLHTAAFSANREKQIQRPGAFAPAPAAAAAAAAPVKAIPQTKASVPLQKPLEGKMGYSAMANNYGQASKPPASPTLPTQAPAGIPAAPTMAAPSQPKLKIAKSESLDKNILSADYLLIRKLEDSDINKASKNVREQRKKVFGTKSQPGANTAMREKHIAHIKNFVDKFLGLDLQPSGGKINEKTGARRDVENVAGEDKPDWRSGKFEAQWNPEAIVHEIAHLMLIPKGVGLEEGQRLMDKQYGDVQKQYGYMKQKRSQGEVQPMAAEQVIRRALGLPASQVSIPVKSKEDPHRVSVEDPSVKIATRIKQGTDKKGNEKYVDLIRQSRNLHPEHKQRLADIFSGKLKFDADKGWTPNQGSIDARITARAPGTVAEKQAQKQTSMEQELPPNVVRMKQPAAPAPAPAPASAPAPAVSTQAPQETPQLPPIKMAKSEQRQIMKILGDQALEKFEKKEELIAFLTEKLPNISEKERLAIAKAVAFVGEKKNQIKNGKDRG